MGAVTWTRSSFCGPGHCVEVAEDGGRVLLRDGKLGDTSPVIEFTRPEWAAFLEVAISGRPLTPEESS